MKRKIKQAGKLTKHHIRPRSRGGSDGKKNIAMVKNKEHQLYHHLFSNMLPSEILDYLTKVFWNDETRHIEKYARERRAKICSVKIAV